MIPPGIAASPRHLVVELALHYPTLPPWAQAGSIHGGFGGACSPANGVAGCCRSAEPPRRRSAPGRETVHAHMVQRSLDDRGGGCCCEELESVTIVTAPHVGREGERALAVASWQREIRHDGGHPEGAKGWEDLVRAVGSVLKWLLLMLVLVVVLLDHVTLYECQRQRQCQCQCHRQRQGLVPLPAASTSLSCLATDSVDQMRQVEC